MNTLVWHLRRLARRLGLPGLAGLALGLAALGLYLAGTLPHQAHIAEQETRLDTLVRRAATVAAPPPAPADPLTVVPPTGEAAREIGTLERLARAHGIALPRGQYSVSAQAGTSLQRWQLVLPVETTYPALVAWLAAALERLPNLALDELKLKRERIETRSLTAEVRLSLYVEAAP